ncbi:MAG: DUF58 domain-containing protein [Planctomycetota bacterium]|jgi:uncharacterized protein (DUF58 family)|nr:DUF58 domain-containing protein [Planctomycetota bacterium]
MQVTDTSLVQPDVLAQLHNLNVAARTVVEGMRAGAHRSPLRGHSVDFRDHRPYVAGDDTRHLDWKVLGRRDRLVLKRYEAEIDLGAHLVVDGSASMAYQGQRAALSKYRYASILAASIAYLVLKQQDRVGLLVFNEAEVLERRPVRQGQLERICHDLDEHTPELGTDTGKGLDRLVAPTTKRGLVVLLSDCLEEPDELIRALDRLRHRGHDVALVWVLDPDELDLGVATVSRFEDMEGDAELVAEPRALRRAYQDEVEKHRLALREACLARRIVFLPCNTNEAPTRPLNELLVALHHDR